MTPAELERELKKGTIRPVYLIVGPEHVLVDQVVQQLRSVCLAGGIAEFNEDKLLASETTVERVLSAVRTVPMMAPKRFVFVRGFDRWEPKADAKTSPLDLLTEYAANPVDSTCLVLQADQADSRRKLLQTAKKNGYLIHCDSLGDAELTRWVDRSAKERGCKIDPDAASHLVRLLGPELAVVLDAVERLCLYVGSGNNITDAIVSDLIVKVREADAFSLIAAVSRKDLSHALLLLDQVYDPRDRGLRLLGLIAWSVRSLLKFDGALEQGLAPEDAAKSAGIPPFKVRDSLAQRKALSRSELERWVLLLSQTDLSLKGSKRTPLSILETLLVDMASGVLSRSNPLPLNL